MKQVKNWMFGLLLLLCVNEILLSYHFAFIYHPITFVFDNVSYTQMTQAFISHHFTPVFFPFSQRLLAPFLASLLPFDDINSRFIFINWLSINIAMAILITLWIRLKAPRSLIIFAVLWILLNKSVAGFFYDNIVNTDALGYLFNAILVWIVLNRNYYVLAFISPFAVLERESFIASVFIIFICEAIRFIKEKQHRPFLLTCVALVTGIYVNFLTNTHLFYPGAGSSLQTLHYWIISRAQHPIMILSWICESATVLGGLPLLLKYLNNTYFKNTEFIILTLISVAFLLFGLLAGSAMSRIICDGSPFIMTVFLYIAANAKIDKTTLTLIYVLSLLIMGVEYLVPWQIASMTREGTIMVSTALTGAVYLIPLMKRLFP